MAVNHHVDHIILQNAEVGLPKDGGWGAKQDIGNVGGDEAATPSITEGSADGVVEDMLGILVVTDVGAVEGFNNLAVNTAGHDAGIFPDVAGAFSGHA